VTDARAVDEAVASELCAAGAKTCSATGVQVFRLPLSRHRKWRSLDTDVIETMVFAPTRLRWCRLAVSV
jgi:hypothetical protein